MTIGQILKEKGTRVHSVTPESTVMDAMMVLKLHGIGAVLVREGEKTLGIVSERDVVRAIPNNGAKTLHQPVSEIMTKDIISTHPDDTIEEAMGLMTEHRIRHLPVCQDGQLVGLVSIGDVVKHRIAETELEAEALKAYIATG